MSANALPATPPSSDIEAKTHLPPSPPLSPKNRRNPRPVVDRLVGLIRLHKAGRLLDERGCRAFKLSTAEYEDLNQRLHQPGRWDWYNEKVRYDWEADSGLYTLRMPTALHEFFTEGVKAAVKDGITDLAEQLECEAGDEAEGEVARIGKELRRIIDGGSTTVDMCVPELVNSSQESEDSTGKGKEVKRSPDVSFYHPSLHFPCLVMETSYSQQQKKLSRLAESYILDSAHAIRCVVGLDITYPSSGKGKGRKEAANKTATISVWRPGFEKEEDGTSIAICRTVIDATPFRDEAGAPCQGALRLRIADLLPPTVVEDDTLVEDIVSTTLKISIPFADLAAILAKAEAFHAASTAPAPTSSSKFRARKRKRTPSEQLSEEKEAGFVRQEESEREREREGDEEYRARVRRRTGVEQTVELRQSSRRRTSGRAVGEGS
jgi:hypothetical protein